MRTFLVTGGAGFIGSHIAEALVRRGDRVRVLDNLSTGNLANLAAFRDRIEWIEGDIVNAATVDRAVEGVDCIFHEAALASVPRSLEAPLDTHAACVTGTVTLLDAARRAGVRRVVYAGSSSAYGDQPFVSKRETDLPAPISPYGAAKLAAEYYCRAFSASFQLETVVLRYFNVFGPRQDPSSPYSGVLAKFITLMLKGDRPTMFGDGEQSRDFTYIDNTVEANLLAWQAPTSQAAGRVFNVATGRRVTLNETFQALKRLTSYSGEPVYGAERGGDIKHSLADISAAEKNLGYKPKVDFEDGLRTTVEWYRGQEKTAGS